MLDGRCDEDAESHLRCFLRRKDMGGPNPERAITSAVLYLVLVTFSTPSGRAARPPSRRSIQSASSHPWPIHGEHARQGQARPGRISRLFRGGLEPAPSCVRQLCAHPLPVPVAPPPKEATAAAGCYKLRAVMPYRQRQAAAGQFPQRQGHISPLKGGIPCVASSLCRDPCSHFTLHHRCGPPIGSSLGPGRLIRLSGWPLAVVVDLLELLGRRSMLRSVMKNEKLSLFICSPRP